MVPSRNEVSEGEAEDERRAGPREPFASLATTVVIAARRASWPSAILLHLHHLLPDHLAPGRIVVPGDDDQFALD